MSTYLPPRVSPALPAAVRRSSLAMPGTPAFTAVLHRRIEDVAALWRVFENQGTCTAYQCFDWAQAIVTQIMPHRSAEPLIVEVIDQSSDQCVMLLPFALTRSKTHSVVTWLDLGVCDYAAPLLAPGFAPTSSQMEGAWSAALAVLPRADLIQIERISQRIGAWDNPLAQLSQARRMTLQAFGTPIQGEPETRVPRIHTAV